MTYFPKPHIHMKNKIEVKLDLSNYVTKSDLRNATDVDTADFAEKTNLTSLKSDIDKLDIHKLEKLVNDLSSI